MDIIYRFDPQAPVVENYPKSPEEALQRLADGNAEFADMVGRLQAAALVDGPRNPENQLVIPISPLTLGIPLSEGGMPSHRPFALVLGCADARVPVELLFECSSNEIFTVRVAGNVLGLECLGSIDYAVSHLGDSLRATTVLGHTGCGAVTAAVDLYLSPQVFMNIASSHAVRSLVDRILLAVRGASRALDRKLGSSDHSAPNYREQLINASIYLNAAVTAFDMQREIRAITDQKFAIAFSVFDVSRSRVSALPFAAGFELPPPFLPAPECTESLMDLADRVVERIVM